MYKIVVCMFVLMLMAATGCQPTKSEASKIELWPLLNSCSTVTLRESGWEKTDKGDAVLISHWNHEQTFDNKGKKTKYDENLEIWPLFNCHSQKTNCSQTDKGTILIFFKYDNSKEER